MLKVTERRVRLFNAVTGIIQKTGKRSSPGQQNNAGPDGVEPYAAEPYEFSQPGPASGAPVKRVSFALAVLVPFFTALLYFAYFASDQYIAEARFAVRSLAEQNDSEASDSGMIGFSSATQDAYIITSFIHSPELLERIGRTIDYRRMFARDDVDRFSRIERTASTEEFQKYWRNQVSAYIDGPSGIITLKVRSFRPEDSEQLAKAIIAESETLINELNRRAQNDLVMSIRTEVDRTGRSYADALSALNKFQTNAGLLSPETQAQENGKLLTGLLAQKMELETRLFVLKQSAAQNSPTFEQLSRAQTSLDNQIAKMRSELTGPESASIAQTILEFSKIETDRLLAEKLYEAARSNYDAALVASMRKALYIMVFVNPSLPQKSEYPARISTPLIVGLGLIVLWATLILVWASVEDHMA
ncbi:capsule biosynthesis protein [Agrobacterium rosae]|uniref:capsule biosynthesis protein n=1 Tax=Agrobacterium rosae TaxID=1972867 RepID=UPI0011AFCDD5|nr:capsule biosynthesis protein [Agrobacterium rosae]